ncbi:MAG: VCBS repeat-containing protein, partial [Pontiellaceae bacterium]|nr:VCBS repeat-containing protein [Pontiellaceae bacterium]
MKTKLRLIIPVFFTVLQGHSAFAEIGFRPLEILKFKHGIVRLACRDLDLDGYDDLVFLNNRDSRIEVLFSKVPPAETEKRPEFAERFLNAGMIADQHVRDIELADLNADRREDLVTIGAEQGLNIHYQQEGRIFSEPARIFTEKPDAVLGIQLGDLDHDQRPDILLLYREKAEILWNDDRQAFSERSLIRFAKENANYA